ncbi:MAG: hypothetical protein IPP19_16855 [Verrucomicrobia bacterium]|nr:hypothetical protein [Verrucomicrobiota bacterium]
MYTRGRIQQVLPSLLINSTQAMPEGGEITLTCHIEKRGTARIGHIDITDTGRGVPETLREKIFDSFLRSPRWRWPRPRHRETHSPQPPRRHHAAKYRPHRPDHAPHPATSLGFHTNDPMLFDLGWSEF